jgi:hypothetical protein
MVSGSRACLTFILSDHPHRPSRHFDGALAPRLDPGSGTLGAAGVSDQVGFATKAALATAMLARALDAGGPAAWVTGDEVDGADPKLRAELETRGIG